jgi:hypothetical protein
VSQMEQEIIDNRSHIRGNIFPSSKDKCSATTQLWLPLSLLTWLDSLLRGGHAMLCPRPAEHQGTVALNGNVRDAT